MSPQEGSPQGRARREPPVFRPVTVHRTVRLSPRMVRVTFTGPALEGLTVDEPAASVRLLLPSEPGRPVGILQWNGNEFLLPDGNEFLLPDGSRPPIRTFTPRRVDPEALELDLDMVIHGGGAASEWADRAVPGDVAAVSGPGRGYAIDGDAPGFLLAGDETAIPAISQLLEALPASTSAQVHVEVAHPDGRLDLAHHPAAPVSWTVLPAEALPGDTLVSAVEEAEIAPGTRIWVAGEAAAVQRIRRHLFEERGLSRAQATVRGYWKRGRGGDDEG